MGLEIMTNIAAMDAYNNLSQTSMAMNSSLEKLSSGYQINSAADNASGLAISEGLQTQIGGLQQAVANAQDGISVVQTAEGALNETQSILQRMNQLAVQAANSGSEDSAARADAQTEFTQLAADIDNIASQTQFGSSNLLDGTFGAADTLSSGAPAAFSPITVASHNTFKVQTTVNGSSQTLTVTVAAGTYNSPTAFADAVNGALKTALQAAGGTGNEVSLQAVVAPDGSGVSYQLSGQNAFTTSSVGTDLTNEVAAGSSSASGSGGVFQVGANAGQTVTISIGNQSASALGVESADNGGTIDLVNNASAAITAVQNAIQSSSTTQASLGAYQNGLQDLINNLNVSVQNLSASNSQIQDTDMASEMVNFTKYQILEQAGTAMLSQANQSPQLILKLLQQ